MSFISGAFGDEITWDSKVIGGADLKGIRAPLKGCRIPCGLM